jgi:pilus assembly protein CpaF
MPYLQVTEPDAPGRRVRIDKNPYVVGRHHSCDLTLEYSPISRRHFAIRCDDEQNFVIEDLNSRNGTYVNGDRIESPLLLREGMQIKVGSVFLEYHESEPAGEEQPAPTKNNAAATNIKSNQPDNKNHWERSMSAPPTLKRKIHDALLQKLDLKYEDFNQRTTEEIRDKTVSAIRDILDEMSELIPAYISRQNLVKEIADEALGLGPLEDLLEDPEIDEIMVNGWDRVYVERHGKITKTNRRFTDDQQVVNIIRRIVAPIGRRIDESSPMVDARLPDGSRVNAIISPLAITGPTLTIRKFAAEPFGIQDLTSFATLTEQMARFLQIAVKYRQNILISGGTGSGKTTLLNVVSSFIPPGERIVTIEDAAELHLPQEHVVSLEAKPPNIRGEGAIPIRELVINSLRMRPDRIIVGECRGGEALDMLQAMNTGHDGSLTTLHANAPRDSLSRLETMVLMAGIELPSRAIREQIASAINLVVHTSRLSDGTRKIMAIEEITGIEGETFTMQPLYTFRQRGFDEEGNVQGYFTATGSIPEFVQELRERHIDIDMELFRIADVEKQRLSENRRNR